MYGCNVNREIRRREELNFFEIGHPDRKRAKTSSDSASPLIIEEPIDLLESNIAKYTNTIHKILYEKIIEAKTSKDYEKLAYYLEEAINENFLESFKLREIFEPDYLSTIIHTAEYGHKIWVTKIIKIFIEHESFKSCEVDIIDYLVNIIGFEKIKELVTSNNIERKLSIKLSNYICYAHIKSKIQEKVKIKCIDFIKPCIFLHCWKIQSQSSDNESKNFLKLADMYTLEEKVYYNFFLDKAYIPPSKEYEGQGIDVHDAIDMFRLSLQNLMIGVDLPILERTRKTLQNFLSALTNLREAADINFSAILKELKIGEFIFKSIESNEHAALLCIIKATDQSCIVVLYNTGLGIANWHIKSPHMPEQFQTFYQINEVSISLLNDQFWNELDILLLNKDKVYDINSFDHVYTFFNAKLNQGKKSIVIASKEFFELGQLKGTCSVQCIYAALKHFILTQSSATKDNLLEYKITKGLIQKEVYEIFEACEVPESVIYLQQIALNKVNKTCRHRIIKEIAENHFDAMGTYIVQQMDISKFCFSVYSSYLTLSQKFFVLRELYERITKKWIVESKITIPISEEYLFSPALLYYQDKKQSFDHLMQSIRESVNFKRYRKKINCLVYDSILNPFAHERLVQEIDTELTNQEATTKKYRLLKRIKKKFLKVTSVNQ